MTSTANELRQHYQLVRDRLWAGKPPAPVDAEILPPEEPQLPRLVRYPTRMRTFEAVLAEIEAKYQVHRNLLFSTKRERPIVTARNELCWRLRELGWSYPQIGMRIGRDHSTVLHSVKRHMESQQCE